MRPLYTSEVFVRLSGEDADGRDHHVDLPINAEHNFVEIQRIAHEREDGRVPSPVEMRRRFPDMPVQERGNLWSDCVRLHQAEHDLARLCGHEAIPDAAAVARTGVTVAGAKSNTIGRPYDSLHDIDDRVHVEYTEGFTNITRGRQRWCFSATRTLALAEQRTLDRLLKLEHDQALGLA